MSLSTDLGAFGISHSPTLGKLFEAFAKAQSEFTAIGKALTVKVTTKTGGSYNYKYADLATTLEALLPYLNKYGIAVFQPPRSEVGKIGATTILGHGESGEWIASSFLIPENADPRAIGSLVTYSRRYSVQGACGAASEDDDGEKARGGNHEMAKGGEVAVQLSKGNAVETVRAFIQQRKDQP